MSQKLVIFLFVSASLKAQYAQNIPQLESSARAHMSRGEVAAALADYQKLASLNPQSAVYEDQIGFIFAATNRGAEAIPHLQKATELQPKMAVAWFHLGVAQCLRQETTACIANLQKAVALEPPTPTTAFA